VTGVQTCALPILGFLPPVEPTFLQPSRFRAAQLDSAIARPSTCRECLGATSGPGCRSLPRRSRALRCVARRTHIVNRHAWAGLGIVWASRRELGIKLSHKRLGCGTFEVRIDRNVRVPDCLVVLCKQEVTGSNPVGSIPKSLVLCDVVFEHMAVDGNPPVNAPNAGELRRQKMLKQP
jgi:hypothetical protein